MRIFKVHISPTVEAEIEHYVHEIAKDSITRAVKWYGDMMEKISTQELSPARYPYADEMVFHDYEIRNLLFGNYRILFHFKGQTVQVMHVKHGKIETPTACITASIASHVKGLGIRVH